MNDDELAREWLLLEPTPPQRQRIESQVLEWLDAARTSLASEWLGLIRVHPASLGYVAVGAASLILVTPLGLLASLAGILG